MSRAASHPRRLAVALLVAFLALALGARAAVATAPTSFAVGVVPHVLAGSTPIGSVGATTPLSLDVVLAPRDPAGLAALAAAVSTPGSTQYHRYLSVAQFAARFGASAASVATVEADLRAQGLTPGALAPDGLAIRVSGDGASASHAFAVSLHRWREPGGRTVFANTSDPRLPPALHGAVTAVLGLDNVPAAAPAGLILGRAVQHARRALANQPAITGPSACSTIRSHRGASGPPYTIDQIAGAYGFGGLYANGDSGAGVTVALFELEPYVATDITWFQTCFGTSTSVTAIPIDGGPTPGTTASAETPLDIENVIGPAPASPIDVYQGPNSTQGVLDTLGAIVNANTAKVISDSWGACEQQADPAAVSGENALLAEAAVQGQTFLVASGDAGSEGCTLPVLSTLAVDDPASQAWATGVGGTSLTSLGPPAVQHAWSHSGGGVSGVTSMPSWQAGPGVIQSDSSGTSCAAPGGTYCREVPDVSADADPATGYEIYYHSGFLDVGGTSAGAPLWAGLVALADSSGTGGCSPGTPLGFLNPSLYSIAAGSSSASALQDVTTGDNNPGGSGASPAAGGYDMVTGLGTPIAGGANGLVAQLCADDGSGSTGPTGSTGGTGAPGATGTTRGGPAPPAVTGLSATDAPPGAVETISGGGFTAGATVSFGGVAAGAVTFVGSGTLRATVPPGSGVVNVTVTTTGGTTAANPADLFTYAPTASIATPAPGGAYTETQLVTASYACDASAPGVLGCTAPVATGSPLNTATTGTHPFTVTATDSNGVQTQSTVSYTVVAPPSASLLVPAAGATYTQGQHVLASFACAASAPVAIAGCTGPVADGAAVNTSTLGEHQFSVSATDADGVSADASVTYEVVAAQPTVSGVRESAPRWLERTGGPSQLPVGTTFSFTLDQAATVTLRFARVVGGRLAGTSCRAGAHHGARCTAHVAAGAITISGHSGAQTFHFAGNTSTGRLAPGVYVVSITAVARDGHRSATKTLRFTVAKA